MKRTPRRLFGMFIAVAALFAVPASAQALSLSGLAAAPASTQAGAHSNFHLHMDFAGGQVKDLTVGLPPGQLGDPNATPLCTVAQLNADACDGATKVGSVTANATVTVVAIPLTLDVHGDLYNLTPQPGEPARFGIVLRPVKGDLCAILNSLGLSALCDAIPNILPPVILQSAVQLRPDYGLNTIINGIPNSTSGLPTTINSQDITLFGTAPGTGKPFSRNPTSCGTNTTSFSAVPYTGTTATGTASYTTTGCENEDFSPGFTAEVGGPGQTANGMRTTAITAIDQDYDEAGLIQAHVLIPHDLAPNLNIFGNSCDPAAFQAGNCPTTSIVGAAIAASPLLSQPLAGNVMLVNSGSTFPNIGLDLKGQLHLLLQGSLALDSSVTFAGLPDIPIAHFQLAFGPDPGMLLANRDLCAPPAPVFHAEFQGYNGASTAVDSAATVDGCGPSSGNVGGKCKKATKKKHKKRAAEAKKKHKKKSCKKKKRKKHRR
jgi:hypothetical protein